MKELKTEGIVLARAEYRDYDRMVTILSPEHGRLDALARGVRKPSAKLRSAAETFTRGEFLLAANGDRLTLIGFIPIEGYFAIREDILRLSLAGYCAAITLAATQHSLPARELYAALSDMLGCCCDNAADPFSAALFFLTRFAELEGIAPCLEYCAICRKEVAENKRFSYLSGGLCHEGCAADAFPISDSMLATLIQYTGQAAPHCAPPNVREAFGLARRYIRAQLGFGLKAEKVLDEMLYGYGGG